MMNIVFIKLKNWRNFRETEALLSQRTFVVGPNASGKSNFLDVFRFFRDICKPSGGGGSEKPLTTEGASHDCVAFMRAGTPR